MPLVLRPPGELPPLTDRLRSLGRARQAAAVGTGLLTLAAAVGAAVALACGLDAGVGLSAWARAVAAGLTAGGAAVLFARGVRRPLRAGVRPQAVAHLLEARYPELNDALASAVAFLEQPEAGGAGGSPRFRTVALRRAETLADRADLSAVVPTRPLARAAAAAAVVGLVAVPLGLWDVPRTAVALARLVDPYGGHVWPARTSIELTTPDRPNPLLAKGEPFPLAFAVRGEIPAEATVAVRLAGGPAAEEHVPLTPAEGDPTTAAAAVTLGPDRVPRDFEFRVTANDADTGWRPVTVAPPPRLVPLDGRPSPQLHVAFPGYTLHPPAALPDGAAAVEAVAGTVVRLAAAADRPIASAVLHYQGDRAATRPPAAVAPLAAGTPFAAAALGPLAAGFEADIPVRVGGSDGTVLSAEFELPLPGLYALRFTDAAGLTGVRLFDLRPFPDPSPNVALDRPTPGRDVLTLLPTGSVTVRGRAEDRTFAVRRLALEYRVNDGPYRELPLADAADDGGAALAGGLSAAAARPLMLAAERTIPLARLDAPADGDTVTIRLAATDWDDRTLGKPPGRSGEVEIRVMSAESMTAHLQRELAGLRPELAQGRDAQRETADRLNEVRKAAEKGPLGAEDRDKLAQVEQAQRQIRGRLADPRDGTRAKAERLRNTARANGLPRSAVTERAEAVARALADLDRDHLEDVDPPIAAARQAADRPDASADPKAVREPLAKAAKHQQGVLDRTEAALEELDQWAGPAEVRGDARGLKEQVARAKDAGQRAADRAPAGTPADRLPPADRAALERAAEAFDKAAEQAGRLATKSDRVAAERRAQAEAAKAEAAAKAAAGKEAEAAAAKDAADRAAAEAAAVEQAARRSGGQQMAEKLRQAADAQRANRPGEMAAAAADALNRLNRMADALAEKGDDPPDVLAKKRKEADDAVDKLADEQDRLAKKIDAAGKEGDPAAKAEQLQQLAAEQDRLRRETERLSRKLDREGAGDAAEQLRRAAREMEQARDDLADGRPPGAKPEDALDRLEDAQDKLQAEKKPDEGQLAREKREELAARLKGFVERQRAAVAEAERVSQAAAADKRWSRPLLASLAAVADAQTAMADELRSFAGQRLAELKVFDRMARQAADNMQVGAKRLRERKDDALTADPAAFDAEAEAAADEVARRPLRSALRRLEGIADAVKLDDKPRPMPAGGGPMGGEGGAPPGAAGGGDGVPPLAQLKALRDWQADVAERTAAFAKAHPDPDALSDDDRDDLRELEQAQKDIAELFTQLLPLFQPPGADIP
jgi:hypothetical protein